MKLGKYKGIRAKHPDITVQEKEIDKVLKNKQHEYAVVRSIDNRPAQIGDEAVLDFDAECKGKIVPGGKGRNYRLLLGSHTFVQGFEDAIVGHRIKDRFDIHVTFPNNYRISDMAGKDAVFHVHLKQLRVPEYQPIDDDFAKDFSEFDTLSEWRAEIYEQIRERREVSSYERLARELLDRIIEASEIPIDEELKKEISMELYEDFLYSLEESGMSFETYCKRSGLTKNQILVSKDEEALRSIQEQYVLHAIANKEKLQVTEEELSRELWELAAEEGEDVDVFVQMLGEEELESIADQLQMNKAMELIIEHAVLE